MPNSSQTTTVLTLANAAAATGAQTGASWADQFGHFQSFVNWSIQVSGTFVGTVTVQGSLDGNTWVTMTTTPAAMTAAGFYAALVAANVAVPFIRANVTAYTSGSITVLAVGVS